MAWMDPGERENVEAAEKRRRRLDNVIAVLQWALIVLIVVTVASCYVYVGLNEESYEPIDCDALYGSRLDSATSEEELNFWGDRYLDCLDSAPSDVRESRWP